MKKHILTIAATLAFAANAQAQKADYLTFQTTDGTEKSITASGLKITFKNGMLTASNGTDTQTFSLPLLSRMFFSATPTGISATTAGNEATASIVGGKLIVNAPAGTSVTVYTADGRRANPSRLEKGIYIVRLGNKTLKLTAQ